MSSGSVSELEGYRGETLKLLEKANAKIGSVVHIVTKEGLESTGILIPRYSHADSEHIVLKLRSGYNIGIASEKVESIKIIRQPFVVPLQASPSAQAQSPAKKNVLLLSTGGTIASKVDYRTGAVRSALSAQELYSAVPELAEIASITPEVLFSLYSENLDTSHWQALSSRVAQTHDLPLDGVVIMLGTDTLGYLSAALSFSLIGYSKPVVFVASQRSSDRPSSDSATNLKAAVRFAAYSGSRGVFVAMHQNTSDSTIAIHSGVRVRKNHTSRRDAFQSIDTSPVAWVKDSQIMKDPSSKERAADTNASLMMKTKFDPDVALIKFYPGLDQVMIRTLAKERKIKGLIVEGTGLGHVSSEVVSSIDELTKSRIFVGMTSQCIWGRIDLNVYDTGRDLLRAGAIPLDNMLSETAFAKLSWALGNFPASRTNEIMSQNLVGETVPRLLLE